MRTSSLSPLSLVTVLAVGCAAAQSDGAALGSDLTMADLPVKITAPVAGTFDQAIDHPTDAAQPARGTFKQRYWYTTEFANGPDSPTLLYLCGEQDCDDSFMTRLADSAKSLHASVALLEHRYYGQSKPFMPATLDDLKYLSIHNALEDIASFEAYAKSTLPLTGKWIVVGGSYAGMLAAFFRQKHPELVVGAWSSSAPVSVQETFWGYDAVAARALGPSCTLLVQQSLDAAGRAFDDPSQLATISTRLFGSPWGQDGQGGGTKIDFEAAIGGDVAGEVQVSGPTRLCNALQQHAMSPLDGLMGYFDPPLTPDDVAPDAGPVPTPPRGGAPRPSDAFDMGPGGFHLHARPDDGQATGGGPPPNFDYNWAAWNWQTCTEVGFFFASNPDRTQSVFPPGIDGSADIAMCQQFMHQLPNIEKTRAEYYTPLTDGHASNIFFVNGTFDPWSSLGFNDPESPPPGNTVFVIQGGWHHTELVTLQKDSPLGVFEAHLEFVQLAKQWLAK
jgi:hypothetical protein